MNAENSRNEIDNAERRVQEKAYSFTSEIFDCSLCGPDYCGIVVSHNTAVLLVSILLSLNRNVNGIRNCFYMR